MTYVEGDEIVRTFSDTGVDEIEALSAPVVPAAPGFFLVGTYDSEPYDVYREPIVAWRIADEWAMPICIDDHNGAGAILRPDGTVIVPFSHWYDSLEEFQHGSAAEKRKRDAASPLTRSGPAAGQDRPRCS